MHQCLVLRLGLKGKCGTNLGKKTRWGKIMGCLDHSWFPDLHYIHEKSVETLGPKYSIVN